MFNRHSAQTLPSVAAQSAPIYTGSAGTQSDTSRTESAICSKEFNLARRTTLCSYFHLLLNGYIGQRSSQLSISQKFRVRFLWSVGFLVLVQVLSCFVPLLPPLEEHVGLPALLPSMGFDFFFGAASLSLAACAEPCRCFVFRLRLPRGWRLCEEEVSDSELALLLACFFESLAFTSDDEACFFNALFGPALSLPLPCSPL